MEQPIEKLLRPTTVNEVLLLNRINELHRDRLLGRSSFDFYPPAKDDFVVDFHQHVLYMAGEALAEEDWRGFTVTAKGSGFANDKSNLFFRQYVDKEEFRTGTDWYVADMLGHLHDKLIRSLAKHIQETK